jgi:hypothetical protein
MQFCECRCTSSSSKELIRTTEIESLITTEELKSQSVFIPDVGEAAVKIDWDDAE